MGTLSYDPFSHQTQTQTQTRTCGSFRTDDTQDGTLNHQNTQQGNFEKERPIPSANFNKLRAENLTRMLFVGFSFNFFVLFYPYVALDLHLKEDS